MEKKVLIIILILLSIFSPEMVFASGFDFNRMNLNHTITSTILPLEAKGGNLSSSQNYRIMHTGYLTSGPEKFGYYRIFLSANYISRGPRDKVKTRRAIIIGTVTFGTTLPLLPIGEFRYDLRARVEYLDIQDRVIRVYADSKIKDLNERLGEANYTFETEPIFRGLVINCLLEGRREAEIINTVLRAVKEPPQPALTDVVRNAYETLKGRLPQGSKIAIIAAKPMAEDVVIAVRQIETLFVDDRRFRVLERSNVDAIINELAFSQSVFTEAMSIRVGRMLSADLILLCDINFGSGASKTLSFRVLDVNTGIVIASIIGNFKE